MNVYDRNQGFLRFGSGFRLTPAVKWLLIINIAVYLLELIIGRIGAATPAGINQGLHFLYLHLAISFNRVFLHAEIWQPFTYMFLHDPMGIGHIFWNMLMLWMFGTSLESYWGRKRFLKFYFYCGLGAAACILLVAFFAPSQRDIPTLGASGALYGMLVAFGFLYPNALIYLFGLFPIKGKHLVMLFVAIGILQSVTLEAGNISLAAHMGGMLTGYLLISGNWRPKKLIKILKIWRLKQRHRRLKQRIHVVGDNDKSGPTMYH